MLLEESDRFRPAELVWVGYRGWGKLAWDHDWSLYSLSGGFSSVGDREEDLERIEEILQLACTPRERFDCLGRFFFVFGATFDDSWDPRRARDLFLWRRIGDDELQALYFYRMLNVTSVQVASADLTDDDISAFCERFKTFQDFDAAGNQARLDPLWLPEELRDPGVMLVAGALWDEDAEVRRRIRKMRVRMGSRRGSWRSQDD